MIKKTKIREWNKEKKRKGDQNDDKSNNIMKNHSNEKNKNK